MASKITRFFLFLRLTRRHWTGTGRFLLRASGVVVVTVGNGVWGATAEEAAGAG